MILKVYENKPENGVFLCKDVIVQAKSVIWNKKCYSTGNFQISQNSSSLRKLDIIRHKNNVGIVMKITKTFHGTEVYGYDLKGLMNFRHIVGPVTYTGTADKIIKDVAEDVLLTGDRKIEGLTISDKGLSLSENKELVIDNKNAGEALLEFCAENEIWYDITFSEQGMVFEVYKGRDKSNVTTFGRAFHNLEDVEYTADLLDTYNVVLDETSGDVVSGAATGIDRREGTEFLPEIETMRGTANDRLTFGTDWILGDYVTINYDNFITVKQITEVEEVYEPSNVSILPIFGTEKENPIKKLLK